VTSQTGSSGHCARRRQCLLFVARHIGSTEWDESHCGSTLLIICCIISFILQYLQYNLKFNPASFSLSYYRACSSSAILHSTTITFTTLYCCSCAWSTDIAEKRRDVLCTVSKCFRNIMNVLWVGYHVLNVYLL